MKFVVYFSPCFFNFHRDSTIQPNNSGTMRIYIYIYVFIYIYIAMATGPFKGHIPVLNKNCANRYVKSPEGFYSTGILVYNLKLRFPLGRQWF